MSLGYIKSQQKLRKRLRQAVTQHATRSSGTRQVKWTNCGHYVLVREGIDLHARHPEEVFAAEEFTEAHFYHWRYDDPFAVRSGTKNTTKYVAVLRWNGAYFKPQFKYMQQCYRTRRDKSMIHSILTDGTPYWCDAYLKHQERTGLAKELYKIRKKSRHEESTHISPAREGE